MKYLLISVLFLASASFCHGGPLRLHKRATFYVANETACVVDELVYSIGEPIPTDNPCETCSCRPPGFACVLVNCPKIKPGCREDDRFYTRTEATQRDVGKPIQRPRQCCPDVICDGCEYNGKKYKDGEKIPNAGQPCITCHCLGTSMVCSTEVCPSRINCASEYVPGECCPRYTNCTSVGQEATGSAHAPSEVDQASSESVNSEESKNPSFQDAPEININSDTLEEAKETQDRGSNSNSETSEGTDITSEGTDITSESIQNVNSTENGESENNKESELLNTSSEITSEENVEEPEKPDENSSESTDEAVEEHTLDETTVGQDLSAETTTRAPTKDEEEIETNTIEKRFRSLENATVEDKSKTTEQSDDVKTTNAEKFVTEAQDKQTSSQESRTTTDVPRTDSSPESSKLEDANSHSDSPNLYNAEEKTSESDRLETVTAVVNVHDEAIGPDDKTNDKTSTSVSSKEPSPTTEPNIPKESNSSTSLKEVSTENPLLTSQTY